MTKLFLKRSSIDRRGIENMRKAYSLDYFIDGGDERRNYTERRKSEERRTDWVRVVNWLSVYVGK